MKRLHKRFLLATFCTLFTATLQAADVTITVNGRVVAKPCTIQTKEANVNLGDLYTRNLQQPGSASGWHNITLSLTDCPIETSAVTAIVTGSTDNTGYYKNEGTAENIQIELRDDQDATLKNGDSKTVIVDEITRNAQFPLKARAITVNGNASQGTIEALMEIRVILRGILFQITVLLCQQAAALLIVVMSPWISRTFLEAQKYPLAYIAQANKSSHFIFRVPPLTVPDKCLLTRHLMQQKHREWVSL